MLDSRELHNFVSLRCSSIEQFNAPVIVNANMLVAIIKCEHERNVCPNRCTRLQLVNNSYVHVRETPTEIMGLIADKGA